VLAAAVGGSRVYVGVHYPLDVIVGAGIGAAVATLSCRLWPSASSCTYPEMLDARRDLARRLGQRSAQLIALGRTLLKAEPLELTIDGERRLVWMGFVGNCRHEPAGFAPSWRPRLDDGCLDVRILLADLPLARPRLMLSILPAAWPPLPPTESSPLASSAWSQPGPAFDSHATAKPSKGTVASSSRSSHSPWRSTPGTLRARRARDQHSVDEDRIRSAAARERQPRAASSGSRRRPGWHSGRRRSRKASRSPPTLAGSLTARCGVGEAARWGGVSVETPEPDQALAALAR
jgi:hypothetical protein